MSFFGVSLAEKYYFVNNICIKNIWKKSKEIKFFKYNGNSTIPLFQVNYFKLIF